MFFHFSNFSPDQLLLPHEIRWIPIDGVTAAFAVIKSMQVRGAPLIAVVGSLGLLLELQKMSQLGSKDVKQKIAYLISSRPTAVDLRNAVNGLIPILEKSGSSDAEKLERKFTDLIRSYFTPIAARWAASRVAKREFEKAFFILLA
uniref:Uncharacterized protein n=1 Tax=Caenorhabditis japonica TaxID=281687 RepID=A0A8R1EPD5_CAEJA